MAFDLFKTEKVLRPADVFRYIEKDHNNFFSFIFSPIRIKSTDQTSVSWIFHSFSCCTAPPTFNDVEIHIGLDYSLSFLNDATRASKSYTSGPSQLNSSTSPCPLSVASA
jgi:hypothetical protein